MIPLMPKIVYRFLVVAIGLSFGLTLVAVFLVFTHGSGVLHDDGFMATGKLIAFIVPVVSALFAIPSALREHRERKGSVDQKPKSLFWEPPD